MKSLTFFLLTFFYCSGGMCQQAVTEQLQGLNALIKQSAKIDEDKLIRIDDLRLRLYKAKADDSLELHLKLYEEYSLFRSDSAFYYASKVAAIARQRSDQSLTAYARMKVAFILLSSGMLKEANDSLRIIKPNELIGNRKAEYYALMSRYYYDLADYTQNVFYKERYNGEGAKYLDSALVLFTSNSFEHDYYTGLRNIKVLNFRKGSTYLKKQLINPALTEHQLAVTASTLSDIYIRSGIRDTAISLLITAAVADIRSSTKETSALFSLATLLFQRGDLENASLFIQKAADDANFYGSMQRKAQLNVILPLINEERLRTLAVEKRNLFTYAIIVTGSLGLLIVLIIIIVRQVKRLQTQQKEIKQTNNTLQHLVEEKEWLLKEIHHRVKNNLQTVVSLLESQSYYLEKDALSAVQSSQHRVYAMSLIHQKLYRNENPGTINMSVYLPELVQYLSDSFNVKQRIRFQLRIDEINLDVSQAIPLGLILNESITNAIKYAFSTPDNNEIVIRMDQTKNTQIELSISDNGIGLPEGLRGQNSSTLGLKLINGLTEDIGGVLTIKSEKGTTILVRFAPNPLLKELDKTALPL
jgi:two-component sensor histidine kinase